MTKRAERVLIAVLLTAALFFALRDAGATDLRVEACELGWTVSLPFATRGHNETNATEFAPPEERPVLAG